VWILLVLIPARTGRDLELDLCLNAGARGAESDVKRRQIRHLCHSDAYLLRNWKLRVVMKFADATKVVITQETSCQLIARNLLLTKYRYINVARSRTWPRFRDQMPDTNVLSPPRGIYSLPRIPVLPPMSTCYRPRPPRLRGLLKEAPEIPCCVLLYHSRIPFRLPFFTSA
jgi:hypothetical protein